MMGEITAHDQPWGADKIRILLWGETTVTVVDATGREYETIAEGMTAYEQRTVALDGGSPELILEPAQLDMAAATINDPVVRAIVLLKAHDGLWHSGICMSDHVADLMGDARLGRNLLGRGADLVRREERARHSTRLRIGKTGSHPVCWRCMQTPVSGAGDDCGCEKQRPAQQRGLLTGPPTTGPTAPYDPTKQPPVDTMTDEERVAEIERLARGQQPSRRIDHDPIPGQRYYIGKVSPYGLSPHEIDEHGTSWSELGSTP